MLKHETFSASPAIHSICRTQALDHLMSEMKVISMAYEQQNVVQ